MTITEEGGDAKEIVKSTQNADKETGGDGNAKQSKVSESIFTGDNIVKDDVVKGEGVKDGIRMHLSHDDDNKEVVITPSDKAAFIDSIVGNTRFEKTYSLYGGRISVVLRSLTSDEVQALAAWSLRSGSSDPISSMSGRYRKYLLVAHVAKLNDVEIPPLQQPLFSRVGSDGKTVEEPGWVSKGGFWDEKPFGLVQAVVKCVENFTSLYNTLCSKAEDTNFWSPDTP